MQPWSERIGEQSGTRMRPASEDDLARVRALRFPESAIEFYRAGEPADCAEIEGIRLWPAREAARENVDFVPGVRIHPRGFAVFATTVFGDAYCFDLSHAAPADVPVVLLAHDIHFESMTDAQLAALAKPIAPSFEAFLQAFVAGELDQEPLYPPFNA